MDLRAKTVGAAERDEQARSAWRERVAGIDPRRLVFVDECGAHVGLAPLRARAPKGERAHGRAPRNRGKNTTLLASMTAGGMGPCAAVEGATTAKVFEAYYVEQVLAPALSPGQIVVLDNLGAHKGERVRESIERRGCELLFLPAYSPDFSPIEEAFSKLSRRCCGVRRRAPARRSSRRWAWRSARLRPRTPGVGSATAVTPSLSRYENRCSACSFRGCVGGRKSGARRR